MYIIAAVMRVVNKLMTAVLIGGLIILGASLIVAHQRGWQFLSAQSNSMVPSFGRGDMLVVKPTDALQIGAVISYHNPKSPQMIISHRLIEKQPNGQLVTAGDATGSHDVPISQSAVLGQALAVVPGGGVLLDLLRRPLGLALLIYGPALAIVLHEMWRLQSSLRNVQYRIAGYQR
jgi:signal peptidase I